MRCKKKIIKNFKSNPQLMNVDKLKKHLEKLSFEELDRIIDSMGISTTDEWEDESKNDKIGLIIGNSHNFSDEEFEKIISQ